MDDDKLLQPLLDRISQSEKILVGLGREWRDGYDGRAEDGYVGLARLLKDKDYFVVTTVTDGAVLKSDLDEKRVVAPCGNETWRQCSKACTRDIWEEGEVEDDICPHCGAPLTGNTVKADIYIEEGYLPRWRDYTAWLAGTLNRSLLVLELGVDFQFPSIIRWPFEKTVFFNKKSHMYRVNHSFAQAPQEIGDRITSIAKDSVELVLNLREWRDEV